jgi:RNA polymerase sigma-32 factor
LSRKDPEATRKPRATPKDSPSAPSTEPEEEQREESDSPDDDAVVGELTELSDDISVVDIEPKVRARTGGRELDRYDPFTAYLSEVQRHPLLTPDEERELSTSYVQTGDVKAAARMVTANLRLVVKIAYEYRRAYKNLMDIVQEGNIGLMQAVKRYDPYRGVKLSTYAAWWIRAYILRFIINNWRLVKLGTTQTQRKLFFNLNKEKQRLVAMGVDPSDAELARRLDVPESEVVDMDRRLSGGDVSLDAPVGDSEGRSISRIDMLASGGSNTDETLANAQVGEMVREKLRAFEATLTGKEVDIYRDRLISDEPVTLQEIGDRYSISRERVRQLEKRLQDKLKVYLQEQLGEAVDFD